VAIPFSANVLAIVGPMPLTNCTGVSRVSTASDAKAFGNGRGHVRRSALRKNALELRRRWRPKARQPVDFSGLRRFPE
jgi:hypothetical protein